MAGIGFVLKKLTKEDNLLGMLRAYGHSAIAATGPWLFTILALGTIMLVANKLSTREIMYEFRLIIIYNFAFSLVFSSPVFMVATRYLADSIYEEDVTKAPAMMLGALVIAYLTQIPFALWLYLYYADMTLDIALSSIINYFLVTAIWVVGIFITALKDYRSVSWAFLVGTLIAVIASALLTDRFGTSGLLNGFSFGLTFILAILVSRIFIEYPYPYVFFQFTAYFGRYWQLALSGFIYNAAAWVDKWIMWFAPEGSISPSGLHLYPNYDSAMFLAYLTIAPSMSLFILSIETDFFEKYSKFYQDLQRKATFHQIYMNHISILKSLLGSGRNFLVFQGALTVLAILTAPTVFKWLDINFMQLGIFRFGALGALFQVLFLFFTIILSYFDNRKASLNIYILFFITNAGFTILFMKLGFPYYGYGYFLSCTVTFIYAAVITVRHVVKLPYHAFITSNSSLKKEL